MPAIVSTNHEMTTRRLWARTQRVSDDTMDLLLGYVPQTNGRLWKGPLREPLLHGTSPERSHLSARVRHLYDGCRGKDVTVNAIDWQTEEFERHRPHLRAVAYRMLGSLSDADDVVQEAWLRLSRSEAASIENMRGWLTTVVARLSLDELRARKSRREDSADAWLPEPIISPRDGVDPEQEALLADSVGLALLFVLDRLAPPERLSFVLHGMFAGAFRQISA